jgi:hypothetical protein
MKFDLGIDTPATFEILFHTDSGLSKQYSKDVPPVVPPRAFTMTWTDIPNLGNVLVDAVLTAGPGQPLCYEQNGVNTAH